MMEEPLRKDVLLNFVLTRTEGLLVAVKAGDSHGCCEHEIVEFSILYGGNRRLQPWTMGRANFRLVRALLE